MQRLPELLKLNFKQHKITEDMIPSVKLNTGYYNVVFISVDNAKFYIVIGHWNEYAKWSGITGLAGTENAVWYEVTVEEFNIIYERIMSTRRTSTIGIPYYYFPNDYKQFL